MKGKSKKEEKKQEEVNKAGEAELAEILGG
jgi:hypothetical protein